MGRCSFEPQWDRTPHAYEKGWARRAVVVRGVEPSGAADFEAVPGREKYDLKSYYMVENSKPDTDSERDIIRFS
jgi:hypothetical protein